MQNVCNLLNGFYLKVTRIHDTELQWDEKSSEISQQPLHYKLI